MSPKEKGAAAAGRGGGGNLIRARAVWLGLALAVLICALTPFNNTYRQGTPLGGGHFPLAPFFILFWLTLLLAVAAKVFQGRRFLTGAELLVSWMLMVMASGVAYTGLVRTFFINLTAVDRFATVANRWEETLVPLHPEAWIPSSPEAVDALYNGLSGGRDMSWFEVLTRIPWGDWARPLLVWGFFILVCYFVMICLVNLFSRQWLVNERMSFPLLRVPTLMEEAFDQGGLKGFLTNPYLLAGLAVPGVLHLINGLGFYFPSVPQIPTLILAGPYFPKYGLFSAFHSLKIYIYPAFIGFAFLTPRQISFSLWAFFIMGGLVIGLLSVLGYNVPAAALGVTFGPHLTRPEETQTIGAYGVFFLFILWLARRHFLEVIRQAFGLAKPRTDGPEWISVRASFWGLAVGLALIIGWCHHFGLPLTASFLLVGAFFLVTIVAARVVCQGGVAYFTLTAAPMDGLLAFFGPGLFSKAGLLTAASAQKALFLDMRESLAPSLFHNSKVGQEASNKRLLFRGMILVLILAVAVSFAAMLALCYKYGIRELQLDWATRTTITVVENVQTLVETPTEPGSWVRNFILAGALVMLILVICYHRFPWWPLHPIGYLTAYSSAVGLLWFSFFLGWASNALCMRYGGVALFKKLRLFFIGLIIGDFLMGGTWALVGLFSDSSYLVLPD